MTLPLGNLPDTRYPDPRIEALDKRFRTRQANAAIERIATGFRWAEGPVWFRDGDYLIFSDIPNNRMLRWLEEDGRLSVFRAPSKYTNGNTRDREGRLISCEHDTGRVTESRGIDGRITVLLDRLRGKTAECTERRGGGGRRRGVVSRSGLWRRRAIRRPQGGGRTFPQCLPPGPAQCVATVVADDFVRPNGIGFSPDGAKLYVVNSGITHGGPAHIRVFGVDGARLRNGRIFADDFAPGMTDGLRCDVDGNVWCSMGWGDAGRTGCVSRPGPRADPADHLPEGCANLCFGGRKKDWLFMCASTSVYALYVNAEGAIVP